MMCWMAEKVLLLTRGTRSCLLSTNTFADPAAPESHLTALFFTHLTAFLPMCTVVMLLLKQTSIPTRCIPKAKPWGKVQLSCGWEPRSSPIPRSHRLPQKEQIPNSISGLKKLNAFDFSTF